MSRPLDLVLDALGVLLGVVYRRRLDAIVAGLASANEVVARTERRLAQMDRDIAHVRWVAALAAAERDFAEAQVARALLVAIASAPENYRATGALVATAWEARGIDGVREAMRAARAAGMPVTVPWYVRQAFPELDETRVRRAAQSDADETLRRAG